MAQSPTHSSQQQRTDLPFPLILLPWILIHASAINLSSGLGIVGWLSGACALVLVFLRLRRTTMSSGELVGLVGFTVVCFGLATFHTSVTRLMILLLTIGVAIVLWRQTNEGSRRAKRPDGEER